MASLDVDSLFTNIPLDETINIIIEKLFSENETVHNLNKDKFKCLFTLATKESYLLFDEEFYQQVDSVAMGFPLGPTLANIFLCHYEDIWLRNFSLECKPSYYNRYVDDIFVLFESEIQVESFKDFMNTCQPKMKFTFEKEQNNCFNFLDVKVIREYNVFITSVYRKPSFSGVYTHFDSYMPLSYKFSLVSTIVFRSFTICCDMPKFHQGMRKIKDIFIKNGCSERFLDKCVKTFLSKVFFLKRIIQTAEKKQVTIVLSYMGMISTELKVKFHKTFKQLLPACDLRVIFKVSLCMKNYFNFKNKIKRELRL